MGPSTVHRKSSAEFYTHSKTYTTKMLTQALYHEGISYAEQNFLDETANHLRVDKELIRQKFDLDGKKVLDFGCGMGGMSLWYGKNWDCEVLGLDIDAHHVRIANDLKTKHGVQNVEFSVQNVLDKPLAKKYDIVFLNDVAEHIQLPILEKIFVELSKSLAEGGGIFVSYPPWKSPYASHVQHVVGMPWCQFLPEGILLKRIEKNNRPIVGEEESNLLEAYKGLNHLTHKKLMDAVAKSGLKVTYRKSHSILNRLPGLGNVNARIFPLDYLITKEFVMLENG